MSRRHWSWWQDGRKWVNEGAHGCKVVPFESEWCPGTDDHGVGDLYWGPPVPWQQLRQGGRIMLSAVLYCLAFTFMVWVVCVRANECTYVCVWASTFRISLAFNMELMVGRLQQRQLCCRADAVCVLCWSYLFKFCRLAWWNIDVAICTPVPHNNAVCPVSCDSFLGPNHHACFIVDVFYPVRCRISVSDKWCSALQPNHWRGCTIRWAHTCLKTFFFFPLRFNCILIWFSYHDQKN